MANMPDAVFLDRDGVINRERADYVKRWDELAFLPGSLDAIASLTSLACPILVITNQSAIGRGIVSAGVVEEIHMRLREVAEAHGGRIDAFYVCPHHPDAGCDCRKPKPGLLLEAAADYELDLSQCVFVGDSVTDRQAALAAQCESILVASGRQGALIDEMSRNDVSICVAPNLQAAVSDILARR